MENNENSLKSNGFSHLMYQIIFELRREENFLFFLYCTVGEEHAILTDMKIVL